MNSLCMRLYVDLFYKKDNSKLVDYNKYLYVSKQLSINIRFSNLLTNLDIFIKEIYKNLSNLLVI